MATLTGQIRCSQCGLTRKISKNLWRKTGISPYWKGRLEGNVLSFSISSRFKETMMPFITKYTKAGSLYCTDDWFAYTFSW